MAGRNGWCGASRFPARLSLGVLVLAMALLLANPARPAHATALAPFIDLQEQGLSLVSTGVGLQGLGAGTQNLTVTVGGPVRAALLYWAGQDRPCPESPAGTCVVPAQPYRDQEVRFDGTPITGTLIGTEGQPATANGPTNNIGYFADVTSIVAAKGTGSQTFAFADGNLAGNLARLSGASLLVLYTNPADMAFYRVLVWDGLDFAFGADPTPGATRVTDPVMFNHGIEMTARQAQLTLVLGEATPARPDRIDISNNPSVVNALDGSSGASWDNDTIPISIPAGVGTTTVQLFSEPVNQNPDHLLWEVAALRVPLSPPPPQPPTISKAFSSPSVPFNGTTTMTLTLANPSTNPALNSVAVTDMLPAGIRLSAGPNPQGMNCGSPTFTAAPSSGVFAVSGATLAIGGTCTITVQVQGTQPGTQVNITGNVTAAESGPGGTATASLIVDSTGLIAPELKITIDPTTKDVRVEGVAGSGSLATPNPITPTTCTTLRTSQQCIYRASDTLGSSVTATLLITRQSGQTQVSVQRLQYSGKPATTPLTNSLVATFAPPSGAPTQFNQTASVVEPGTPATSKKVTASWTATAGSTTVTQVTPPGPTTTCPGPGPAPLAILTNAGALRIPPVC